MTDQPTIQPYKIASWLPVSVEWLADAARTWQERAVLLRSSDPNPFPRFHLFRKETK